jgi:hypothetical protein
VALEVTNPAAVLPAKPQVSPVPRQAWLSWAVSAFVFVFASVLFFTVAAKNDWTAEATRQITDDVYLHADLTQEMKTLSSLYLLQKKERS